MAHGSDPGPSLREARAHPLALHEVLAILDARASEDGPLRMRGADRPGVRGRCRCPAPRALIIRCTRPLYLLAWYFLAVSHVPFGAAGALTHGPFESRDACQKAASWLKAQAGSKYPIVIYPATPEGPCWWSPR